MILFVHMHNIVDIDELKIPIHVISYDTPKWSIEIYEIIDNYEYPLYGKITVLIDKEKYLPCSRAKSARK